MKTVLFFQYPWRLWRERLSGVYRYARKVGWHVQVMEWRRTGLPVRDAIRFWKPVGCMVEGGYVEAEKVSLADFGTTPVVFTDTNAAYVDGPFASVRHDSAEAVALAVQELAKFTPETYGYVGTIQRKDWSEIRARRMEELIAARQGNFSSYELGEVRDAETFMTGLRLWLRGLRKPCGILGANDTTADLVLQACKMERLEIPEQVQVVGIDNDELVCENSQPTLTSVAPDFERSGYAAAELLDARIQGYARVSETVSYGAIRLVRRKSTFKFVRRDEGVTRGLEFIRRNISRGITCREVLEVIGGSRRSAEIRFKTLTGQTIGEAVVAARVQHAQKLILRPGQALDTIYAECGYASDVALRRAFKQVTGLSPRAWRDAQSAR